MSEKTYLTISLKAYGIRVFRNALKHIGVPPFIRFLISPDGQSIVLQAYDKKDQKSFKVPKRILDNKDKSTCLRVHSAPLCRILASNMGWDMSKTYRIPGEIHSHQQIVSYDLTKAFPITSDCWTEK